MYRLPKRSIFVMLVLVFVLTSCSPASDWTRRDMPTDGLDRLVTYNLQGPANTDQEKNFALLRGVNSNAPLLMQETDFNRMSGSKTQDVQVTLPNGNVFQALGEVKTQRFAGLTNYLSSEISTVSAVDFLGNTFCGAKVRMQFNRNFLQYADASKRDWDSIWYYDVPCSKNRGNTFTLDLNNSKLRSVVLSEVWQIRIASGSFFFNWGHSVTALGGILTSLPGPWWLNWDVPNTDDDTMGAYKIINSMVLDLESSPSPWVEFTPGGQYDASGTYLIYSAGDADQYATWNRVFLNRQNEYAVLYRPNQTTPWHFFSVKPIYNVEWNDVAQVFAGIRGLNKSDPLNGHLDASGAPKDASDSVVKEIESIGWQNAPNASLEQIQIKGENGEILYTMTVRAFIGANDSLIMFGPATPPQLADVQDQVPAGENEPRPIVYDDQGKPLSEDKQTYTPDQWAEWQRESTMWNFIRDNPKAVGADLEVQMRQIDNTKWAPVECTDSDGDKYVCGYTPVEWNLSSSYYFSSGDVRKAWAIFQLLGEVGVRTLGMSYNSGRYQGTGMLFAMAQIVNHDEFFAGYEPESIWTFDARASQLPDRLAEAMKYLNITQ
jgi:hypothetical protein